MNRFFVGLVVVISFISISYASERYSFGVVPQQSTSKLVRSWAPIFKYIEQQSGVKLQFATKRNIPTFEEACASADYDFVYMNPYNYVQFHDESGYEAIAKARDKKIKGIIVVRKDSKFKKLKDLSGKKLAFASHLAFGASLIPRNELKKRAVKYTSKYLGSHDLVYLNVAQGNFVAGGGVMRTFQAANPEVRKKLKVLWTSKGNTPHAFAAQSRVPKHIVNKVQQVLVSLEQTAQGKTFLNKLKIKGIEVAKNSDWDDIRKLKF